MWADDLELSGGLRRAAQAAGAAPPGPGPPRAVDVLLDAFAVRLTRGYPVAAPTLTRALERLLDLDLGSEEARRWLWMVGARASGLIAMEVWEFESWHTLALRQVQVARDMGALVHLQFALTFLVVTHLLRGELSTAARLIDEDRLIADATGNPPVAHTAMMLAAWRGVAWRGVAWRGVAWRGVAWRGVAWRGVAWRGVAWRGVACGVAWRARSQRPAS